ncbi:MAG TPA: hypothetical protein VHB72_04380 [Candidatus Saccharimonadales bacterium]|nr:hypothetical protein [Candidatus Saccharimonadales bacterium]
MGYTQEAPVTPSTAELKAQHGVSDAAQLAVLKTSEAVSDALVDPGNRLVAIIGGSAMSEPGGRVIAEGARITRLSRKHAGLIALHRASVWKPRSNPEAWHGLETTDPAGAYATLASLAIENTNVAIELAHDYHLARYGHMLSFGWFGSRSQDNQPFMHRIARRDPKLPLGIKNGLDGSIGVALERVDDINRLRTDIYKDRSRTCTQVAPAIMIFRGGEEIRTPRKWRSAYVRALEATEGRLIVDTAHGSEMAHDPEGEFGKTVEGQKRALQTVLDVASEGYVPAGIMMEASDIGVPNPEHRTGSPMPLDDALEGAAALYELKVPTPTPSPYAGVNRASSAMAAA